MLISFTPNASAYQQTSQPAQDAVKVIQGLKDRRLFELADIYASELLASESLSQIDKGDVVLEWIRCKVTEATSLTAKERADAWSEAQKIAQKFASDFPAHHRQILVDVQDALGNLTHGNLIQQEINAEIQPPDTKPLALDQFRIATQKFKGIEKQIEQQLPIARSRSQNERGLSPQQLVNLKNNVRFRLAVINLAKAELYDANDRLNQVDALNQVLFRLDEVITQSNSDVPLWWDAQISRAKCYRLMKEPQLLAKLLGNLPDAELSPDLQGKLLTERILAAISFKQTSSWPDLLQQYANIKDQSGRLPQLELAVLDLLMTNAAEANSDQQKKEWQSKATQLVTEIENTHGQYWGRRAEILLVGSVETNPGTPTASGGFELLVRQGDAALRRKNIDGAIKAYSKAVEFAFNANHGENAIAMTVRLAQCFEQQKRHADAAARLFAAADRFVNAATSSSVHLRGCWNLGQIKTAEPTLDLIGRLKNQTTQWPDDENSNQAKIWLASRFQNDGDWKSAMETYLSIETDSSKMLTAIPFIESSADRWIASVRDNGEDWTLAAQQFVDWVSRKIRAGPDKDEWSDAEKRLLLTMLDIGLPAGAVNLSQAKVWLDAAIQDHERTSADQPAWRHQAMARRIVLFAKQRSNELPTAIQQMPNDAIVLRECMTGIKNCLTEPQMVSISDSLVTICNKALVGENLVDKDFWVLEKAKAEVAGGVAGNAIKALKELANKNPKSLEIQLAYARALTEQEGDRDLAIKQWRRLSSKVKKGTDAWFESKYNVIELMKQNGQTKEAEKLFQYLQATSPGWKASKWSKK